MKATQVGLLTGSQGPDGVGGFCWPDTSVVTCDIGAADRKAAETVGQDVAKNPAGARTQSSRNRDAHRAAAGEVTA